MLPMPKMLLTLWTTAPRRLKRNAVGLLLPLFAACNTIPPHPAFEMCSIDGPQRICYRLLSPEGSTDEEDWEYVGDKSLTWETLDKQFIITPEHVLVLKRYVRELRLWGREHCE